MEEALAHMACTLTRKLMANIPVDAERIKAVVSEAIGELERDAALQIRIHPDDLSLLSDGIEGKSQPNNSIIRETCGLFQMKI